MNKGIFREVIVSLVTAVALGVFGWYVTAPVQMAVMNTRLEALEELLNTRIDDQKELLTKLTSDFDNLHTDTDRAIRDLSTQVAELKGLHSRVAEIEQSTRTMGTKLASLERTPALVPGSTGKQTGTVLTWDPGKYAAPLPAWNLMTLSTDSDVTTPGTYWMDYQEPKTPGTLTIE